MRERPQHEVDPLVLLESAKVGKNGPIRTLQGVGRVYMGVDSGENDPNAVVWHPAGDEVIPGALADGLEGAMAVDERQRALGQPHGRGQRRGQFLEGRTAEQVRDEGHHRGRLPPRREDRHLVDILDQDVEVLVGEVRMPMPTHQHGEGGTRPDAVHLDAVERGAGGTAGPPTAEQHHVVPSAGEPSENLVQMNLSAAGERVLPTLPVDDRDPQPATRTCGGSRHRRPSLRAYASSTPFTKRALRVVP